jgi:glycosyltransferase involved in cell wall biosynthesis
LRVTLVTNSKSGGGAERSMNLLANSLQNDEIVTSIFPLTNSVPDLIEIHGEAFEPIFDQNKSIRNLLQGVSKFRSEVIKQETDVAVLNCDLPEFLGLFLPRKVKLVVVEHARHPWGGRRLLGIAVRALHSIRGSSFVAVSNHLRIWPLHFKYEALLPNMVTGQLDFPKEIELTKVSRLIFIGRLSKLKRPKIFVQICKDANLPGLIIGEGPLSTVLKSRVLKHNLDVEFLGYKKNPWEFLTKGDLVIVPSRSEGDGLVVLEALQNGFPLLVSDIKDFQRFGFSSDLLCGNVKDFTKRVNAVSSMNNPIRISENTIREILQTRKKNTIINEWTKFLKKMS